MRRLKIFMNTRFAKQMGTDIHLYYSHSEKIIIIILIIYYYPKWVSFLKLPNDHLNLTFKEFCIFKLQYREVLKHFLWWWWTSTQVCGHVLPPIKYHFNSDAATWNEVLQLSSLEHQIVIEHCFKWALPMCVHAS